MADVRLTATNPEDSSVVPVACDASGRLLLEEPQVVEGPPGPEGPTGPKGEDGKDGKDGDPFSGNFADDVTFGGSASFAGSINTAGLRSSCDELQGVPLNVIRERSGPELLATFKSSHDGPGTTVIRLHCDGSVDFAAGKAGFTAEGYLWCTTRRGDIVVLDATSNGLGTWVEYTPTSRIDDVRDKLDANNPDTGEMPADTP